MSRKKELKEKIRHNKEVAKEKDDSEVLEVLEEAEELVKAEKYTRASYKIIKAQKKAS